jgi:predicted DCC family thiol-disulfide oxidoreductase YuxK
MARWVRRRDRAGRVQAIANQQRGALERYGVTREEAVNRVLAEMGGAWPAVARLYKFPPTAALEEASYRWFARNRTRFARFGVTAECDEPGANCA